MSGNCAKCEVQIVFKETRRKNEVFGYPCDHCKKYVCQNCSDLSTTEIQTILLSKRVMPFYCKECLQQVKQLLNLVNRVDDLEKDVSKMSEEIRKLPSILTELKEINIKTKTLEDQITKIGGGLDINAVQNLNVSSPSTEVIAEIQDRQNRLNNLMIFNLPENGRDEEDIRQIFNDLVNEVPPPNSIMRIGKRNAKGARSLKISLNTSNDVQKLFKNRHKLKGKHIYLGYDLTHMQRQDEKAVLEEFRRRKSNGESGLTIKYINNHPKIVKQKN